MTSSRTSLRTTAFLAAMLLLPTLAQAHPGHGADDFASGLTHPFQGWDHLLAMLAIGLWAVQLGGRALWLVPGTFVAAAAVGGALGVAGAPVPMVEQGILASVFVLGVMLLTAYRLPLAASLALTAVFAVCHGFAHGAEMPVGGSAWTFGVGFILATVVLHALGMLTGWGMRSAAKPVWLRAAGAAVIVAGGIAALS